MGIALSQIEDEVRFDTLFMVFGARKATRGQLLLIIYSVWCQESAPRSTLTDYLWCLVPGGQRASSPFMGTYTPS
eukprot:4043474-Heterocapsa_arctica.AAC.1